MRYSKFIKLIRNLRRGALKYPVPSNLNYFWNFGSIIGLCLACQFVSGIFLAMHFSPENPFESVDTIMREVRHGAFVRYVHANGASLFFFSVYWHMGKALYYGSYAEPRQALWRIGIAILLTMILTAFIGYVLPWGQMSFWGVTVITNLVTAFPWGHLLLKYIWGGYGVGLPTVGRFYSLHWIFAFLIVGLVLLHLVFLKDDSSNNPMGTLNDRTDRIPFHPYFTIKDYIGFFILALAFGYLVFYAPNLLGHTDNYIKAKSMETPSHIVPEWYLLPFYGILRSVPNKLGGVILILLAILLLTELPSAVSIEERSNTFRPSHRVWFWFFVVDVVLLGWIGSQPVVEPYYTVGQGLTFFYFILFSWNLIFSFFDKVGGKR